MKKTRFTDAQRVKILREAEYARPKKLVAERDLEIEVMKAVAAKKVVSAPARRCQARLRVRTGPRGSTSVRADVGRAIKPALVS